MEPSSGVHRKRDGKLVVKIDGKVEIKSSKDAEVILPMFKDYLRNIYKKTDLDIPDQARVIVENLV